MEFELNQTNKMTNDSFKLLTLTTDLTHCHADGIQEFDNKRVQHDVCACVSIELNVSTFFEVHYTEYRSSQKTTEFGRRLYP